MPRHLVLFTAACAAVWVLATGALQPVYAADAQQPAYMPQAAGAMPFAAPPVPAGAPAPALPPAAPLQQINPAPVQQQSSGLFSVPDVNLSWKGYFEALAILCFVLVGFIAILWLLKRFTRGGLRLSSNARELRIENRMALGPKKWIMVVTFMDRRLLLGVTEQRITLLTELPADSAPEKAAPGAPQGLRMRKGGGKDEQPSSADPFAKFFDEEKGF